MRHSLPVYRNETEAIAKMLTIGKSFFVRDRFYHCISAVGNMKGSKNVPKDSN